MDDFYDQLSPFYHLIFQDWQASIDRQGQQLAGLIRQKWGPDAKSILDVSCGVGTQSLGLAAQGFQVTGSDLSKQSIARARREATDRSLNIRFSVCDMRHIADHHPADFDVVLSADNSVPHLLSDDEIMSALRGMHSRLRPGGGCIITLRDYDQAERGTGIVKPYGARDVDGKRYLIWQVWDFEGDHYALSMYFVEDDLNGTDAKTHVSRSRYYAISPDKLLEMMGDVGFENLERRDDIFFQPLLSGTRTG